MHLRVWIKKIQWIRSLVLRFRILSKRYLISAIVGGNNYIKREGISIQSRICVHGKNNFLEFQHGSVLLNARIEIYGNYNKVLILSGAYLEGTHIIVEDNQCYVSIGKNTFIGPSHLAITEDYSKLTIGNNCMISSNVQIRTGDSHSIIDKNGKRINHAANIIIDDMVWIGEGSKVLKGVCLSKNTIVSTGSIITKSFEANVLLGGIPAKILKENVRWTHSRK